MQETIVTMTFGENELVEVCEIEKMTTDVLHEWLNWIEQNWTKFIEEGDMKI